MTERTTAAPKSAMRAGYATRTAEPPVIVCPSWCVTTRAEHIADLDEWEGFVIHWSAEVDGIAHSRGAFPDGRQDPLEPPQVHVYTIPEQLDHDGAKRIAARLLSVIEEGRA